MRCMQVDHVITQVAGACKLCYDMMTAWCYEMMSAVYRCLSSPLATNSFQSAYMPPSPFSWKPCDTRSMDRMPKTTQPAYTLD